MTDSSLGIDRQRLPNHESKAQDSPTTESPPAEIEAPPSETIAEIDQIWQRAGLSAAVRADGLIEVERHLALASEFDPPVAIELPDGHHPAWIVAPRHRPGRILL